jgi:hypothetical protein
MSGRILAVALVLCALSSPATLGAQTQVTFEAPVKLTQLAPEITAVQLYCEIKSTAIVSPNPGRLSATDEVPVVAGQLTTTLRVVLTFPQGTLQSPVGQTATYMCEIKGRTQSGLGGFSDTATNPIWVLKPNAAPVQGTFVW